MPDGDGRPHAARLPDDAWLTLVEQLRGLDREDFEAAVLAVKLGRRAP